MSATKELMVRPTKNGMAYTIHYEQGGELPKELRGQFTKRDLADEAVARYLANRKPSRGTTKSSV